MTVFEVQSPRGKTYEIEADRMPSGAQLQALLFKMERNAKPEAAPEQPSAMSRFVSGAAQQLNPITIAKGIGNALLHPQDTTQALVDAQANRAIKAYDLAKEGRYSEAAGNAGAAVLPVLGPIAADIGEQAGSGDVAGAAGKLAGLAVLPSVAGKTAKAGRAAVVGARTAAPIAVDVAKAVAASDLPEAAAATLGASAAGVPGAVTATAAVRLARALPELYQTLKASVSKARGVSGAQAEAILQKLSPEELQAIAGPDWKVLTDEEAAAHAARMASKTQVMRPAPKLPPVDSGIRPIPPNKLPPVLPDPVVPEKIPTSEVITAPPAFKGQQGAKGATKARFEMVKDRIEKAKQGAPAINTADLVDDLEKWIGQEKLTDKQIVTRLKFGYQIPEKDAQILAAQSRLRVSAAR